MTDESNAGVGILNTTIEVVTNDEQDHRISEALHNDELIINSDGSGIAIEIPPPLAEDTDAENDEVIKEVVPSKTVVQEAEIFSPLDNPKDADYVGLSLQSARADDVQEALLSMPNVNIEDSAEGTEWLNRINSARFSVPYKNWFERSVDRDGSEWRQSVKSEKGPLTAGGLKFNDPLNSKLTGERAVLRVRSLTGLGSVISVPLWHSGFWLTLKAPTESALLELNRRLTEEKIQLGRATYGLAFANNSVFFAGWLLDFAMSHVYDTSLRPDISDIRKHISILDIPLIVWGLACTIYPNGFPYARSVLDQKNNQNKTIKEKINIGKTLFVDNSSLSPWQIGHMAKRYGNVMTEDSLKKYREEFVRGQGRTIQLTELVSATLRVPNIDQYLTSGQKWVNNIVTMVDNAFALKGDESVRDSYIVDQGKATNMRQFSHFVESIEPAGSLVDDEETIEQLLDVLSSDDSTCKAFFDGVKTFTEDSTIALIAIPVTENEDRTTLPRFPHLIPIDVMSVFFIQLVQKVLQIQSRG